MKELHKRIKHVIYIIKENRTYDQVLGDLDRGNGDPYITEFGEAYTPSQHALATNLSMPTTFIARATSAQTDGRGVLPLGRAISAPSLFH
jgi:phospholipase C